MKRIVERAFFGLLLVLCLLASFTIGASHGVAGPRLNLTPSVPRGLYLYVPGPVKRGELVQACLPRDLAAYARDHGILLSGPCPSGVEPLVKVLAAASGDVINVSKGGLLVNGRSWPSSAIRSIDSSGHRVDMRLPSGTQRLVADRVLLLGLHPLSWDGRYFGALPSSVISGRWLPLITERTTK